jgi:transcriptional regulator with XRE-family HTH domain
MSTGPVEIIHQWVSAADGVLQGGSQSIAPVLSPSLDEVIQASSEITPDEVVPLLQSVLVRLARLRDQMLTGEGDLIRALEPLYSSMAEIAVSERLTACRIGALARGGRSAKRWTLAEVGAKVGGKTASYISQIEHARTIPSPETSARLDVELGLPVLGSDTIESALADHRGRRAQVESDGPALDRRLRPVLAEAAAGVEAAFLDGLLSRWQGPRSKRDMQAIQSAAESRTLREALSTLSELPAKLRGPAIEFLKAADEMNREARPPERVFSPWEQLQAARSQGAPSPSWSLPALLVALVHLFTPSDNSPAYEVEFAHLEQSLGAKGIDLEEMVRGPVLRNAAAVTIASYASRDLRGGDGLASPRWSALSSWLDSAQERMSRRATTRTLWAYWASVPMNELLTLPAPPELYAASPPSVEPRIQWIFDRCTENELTRWSTSSLEFERSITFIEPEGIDSLRSILSIRSVNAADVGRELYRRQTERVGPDFEMTLRSRLQEVLNSARSAFETGNYVESTRLFRVAIQLDPESADAENNLGFLLLSQGAAQEAIEHLERAERLDYDQPEILTMNLGCAKYVLGDYAASSELFERTLKLPAAANGWLLQIRGRELEILAMAGSADYTGLAALNGAWSALRQSDVRSAIRLHSAATVGLMSLEEPDRTRFETSLVALANEIRVSAGVEMELFEASQDVGGSRAT